MRRIFGVLGILGLMTAVMAAPAIAESADDTEAEEKAPVSGIYKDRNNSINVSGPGFGVTGVTSAKKDSSPCKLSIMERSFSGQGSPSSDLKLNACPGKSSRVAETAQFEDPNVFVRGISVCLSRKASRLRPVWAGVKLSGARVEGSTVTPLGDGGEVAFARKSCSDWQEPVFCDEGEIATGVTAHFRYAKLNDFQIVGLGLVCEAPA